MCTGLVYIDAQSPPYRGNTMLAPLTGLTSVAFFPTTEFDPMGDDLNALLLKAAAAAPPKA